MLGYLEQQPLYNSCNFSWSVQLNGWAINSTVASTVINSFICPSDGLSPMTIPSSSGMRWSGRTNNYFGSVGTSTTAQVPGGQPGNPTTGVFTEGGPSYGVQNITDGTSNTIAFGETLIGLSTANSPAVGRQPIFRDGNVQAKSSAAGRLYDANSNIKGVLTDLAVCQAGLLAANYINGDDRRRGCGWALDDLGPGRRFQLRSCRRARRSIRLPAAVSHPVQAAGTGTTAIPTAITPAAPTSCSPTAASASSSRRSRSRRTGPWAPRPTGRSSRPIATDLGGAPGRAMPIER